MNTAMIFASEKEFLISLALSQFNAQYKRDFKVDECDIVSIANRPYTDRGYEITTNRFDDKVVLHMYVTFGSSIVLSPYRLEVQSPYQIGDIADERYVTYVGVDRYYIEQGVYKFKLMLPNYSALPIIILENGSALLMESGIYIQLE